MILLALLVETTGLVTTVNRVNNSVVYNALSFVEFILQLGLIHNYVRRWNSVIFIGAGLGAIVWFWSISHYNIFDFLFIEAILGFALVLMSLSLAVLWRIARSSDTPLQGLPEFWLLGGILIYHGSLLPVLAMIHFVFAKDDGMASLLWYIPPFLCVLRYACIAGALVLARRRVLSSI